MAGTGTALKSQIAMGQFFALALCLLLAALWYPPTVALTAYGYAERLSLNGVWRDAGADWLGAVAVLLNGAAAIWLAVTLARKKRHALLPVPLLAAAWDLFWPALTLLLCGGAAAGYGEAAAVRLTTLGWLYATGAALLPVLLVTAVTRGRRLKPKQDKARRQEREAPAGAPPGRERRTTL